MPSKSPSVSILDEINQVVVKAGHSLVTTKKDQVLRGSCYSFVVEKDVHYPTDTNLLFDVARKMVKRLWRNISEPRFIARLREAIFLC